MKVRTLNSAGIRLMERHLDSIRAGTEEKSTLDALMTDAAYSAPTSTRIEVTKRVHYEERSRDLRLRQDRRLWIQSSSD